MLATRYHLTLHDTLYYATREMGRLYETERIIHNWALTYALGLVHEALQRAGSEGTPYFSPVQVPRYREELPLVNQLGVYVTPARPLSVDFALHTFKLANNRTHQHMEKPRTNKPTYGRAKELAPESTFEFFVLGKPPKPLPRWIRLGLWMSKAQVEMVGEPMDLMPSSGKFVCSVPMNPLDMPEMPTLHDLIAMPPVSLVLNARMEGRFVEIGQGLQLPADARYLSYTTGVGSSA